MEQDKKAAKIFVDKSFPKYPDVLADIFPPKPSPLHEGQSSAGRRSTAAAAADGNSKGKTSKSSTSSNAKKSNKIVYGETSVPCSYSSGVDYGCRDNYLPIRAGEDPSDRLNIDYDKDKKKGENEIPDPQHSRGEWWQGSLHY